MNQLQAIRNALLTAKRDGGKAVPVSYHERKANLKKFNPITGGDGEPKVFYHGTSKDKDFKSFNVGRHGAWFTSDPDSASSYADNNDSQGHSYERGEFVPKNNASRVMPVHLNVENPYRGEMPDSFRNSENYKSVQSNWFDSLRAAGHDSWVPDVHKGELVVVLKRPAQVKSAIGNQGTFDPSSPDTNKADGGRVRKADGGTLTYIDPVTGLPRQGMDTPKNFFAPEPAKPNFAPPSQMSNDYPGGAFEPDDFGPGQTQPGGGAGPAAASQPDFNKSLPGTESTNYGRIGGLAGSLFGPVGYAAGRAAGTAADVNAVNKSIKGYGFGEELTPGQIASGVGNSMSFGLFGTPMGEAATQNINAGVNAFEQDPANAAFMANSIADDLAGPGGPQSGMATSAGSTGFGGQEQGTGSTSAGSTGFGGQEQDVDAAANEAASSETESASESESESGDGGDGGDGGGSEGGGDERRGGRVYHKASGGSTMPMLDHAQAIRAALLTARGMADGGEARDLGPMGLYSHAAEQSAALPQAKGSPQQMLATLQNKGVKPAEVQNSGAAEAFAGKPNITREELAQHFQQQMPQVEETVLSGDSTKYHAYTLPGSMNNYREVLLKYPYGEKRRVGVFPNGAIMTEEELANPVVRRTAEKIGFTMEDRIMMPTMEPFKSPHWDEPNVLAHLRMADRDNGKTLHLEELQSDWGQQG
jgi:hypothetical protein